MVKYIGNINYKHDKSCSAGILLTNLGTPEEPTPSALRRYLAEFLSDPRVIEIPKPIWWFILHGIILRLRPGRSAKAYQKIWTKEGSPLLNISKKQAIAIQDSLNQRVCGPVQVELAMRYGKPSIASALDKLGAMNIERLLVFPLYPQYSATTTGSTFDAVTKILNTWRRVPAMHLIDHYYNDEGYISTLAESIRSHWARNNKADKLLFSFHGLPEHYVTAGDPYFDHCHETARLLAERLQLDNNNWEISFQSRFGPATWLKPYTDVILKQWAKSGIESVDIICPGFSADCLETLEEMNIQNRTIFLAAGGKQFSYIEALNDHPAHIDVLTDLILKHCQCWPEFSRKTEPKDTNKH